jgi:hypothetical protein
MLIDINANSTQTKGGTVIINDGNVASTNLLRCDSNNLATTQTCHYTFNTATITDGNYFFIVDVNDGSLTDWNAGAKSSMIDNNTPTITITTDVNAIWQNSDVNFRFSISDANSGVSQVCTSKDGVGQCLTSGFTDLNAFFATDGNHTIDVNAIDRAGNVYTMTTKNLAIDKTPSTVLNTSFSYGGQITGKNPTLSFDINAQVSGTNDVNVTVNDVNNNPFSFSSNCTQNPTGYYSCSWTETGLTEAKTNTLNIHVRDAAKNYTLAPYIFTYSITTGGSGGVIVQPTGKKFSFSNLPNKEIRQTIEAGKEYLIPVKIKNNTLLQVNIDLNVSDSLRNIFSFKEKSVYLSPLEEKTIIFEAKINKEMIGEIDGEIFFKSGVDVEKIRVFFTPAAKQVSTKRVFDLYGLLYGEFFQNIPNWLVIAMVIILILTIFYKE